ncbi:Putative proline iminopeptidase [Mycoplasmopsis agalactiae]|uniref:prolyl aminopeptidase n=1 Tax=Mycoplasmopsis agalactiae TaxID=2110 RepID=UPI000C705EE0|nr:prolyl aminopeptidase [Mycoplasmopsis agalactiae]MCE6056872.1 prolyl aminopeptidase [Mycoplasmopsis agalactiae]MCE6078661.1 prolyl aminopeptidase [Mycoplasmopsis agalactiae]MCE6095046.1 prolyl aminopeptidase [Mycoplasmopsis agalactiae]MCE6114305.1 prolyl aminopeptidase [Mycoplasmopsis agalactiae]NLS34716.1 prolyl aminopeptidase [Mycoplasmopsis agalactiae]
MNIKYLYDSNSPYESGYLKTEDGMHEIYYEVSGNPDGIPVLYIHGGPGAGCNENSRRLFNPKAYKIVLFDQRGCGKSKPSMSLINNTTWFLINDIEMLRKHLKIDKWMLFGGSWGTTLALCYAINHPDRVSHIVLRGLFLGTKHDLIWLYQDGANRMNPVDFERYIDLVPVDKRNDVINYYHKLMNDSDPNIRIKALNEWARWESVNVKLLGGDFDETDIKANSEIALIENHYFVNNCFFEEGYILNNIHKIKHISADIIHGAYDLICQPYGAYLVHKNMPNSTLKILKDSGHSQWSESIVYELVKATDKYAIENFIKG